MSDARHGPAEVVGDPTNVEVFNNILDEDDNLWQYVIGQIPRNALVKTDPSTLFDASGANLTHQQVFNNILDVNSVVN